MWNYCCNYKIFSYNLFDSSLYIIDMSQAHIINSYGFKKLIDAFFFNLVTLALNIANSQKSSSVSSLSLLTLKICFQCAFLLFPLSNPGRMEVPVIVIILILTLINSNWAGWDSIITLADISNKVAISKYFGTLLFFN